MNEAEALALISDYANISVTSFSVYLTITFAYLTVAYLAGTRMKLPQVFAISGLYVIAAGSAIICTIICIQAWGKIKRLHTTILDEFFFWSDSFWISYLIPLMVMGVFIGIYFMWNIRREDVQGNT